MEKQKIAKELTEEEKQERHHNLLNTIIAETFSRHSKLTEEEFLENIGFKDSDKNEEEAIRIAKYNVLLQITKTILSIEQKMNVVNSLLRRYLLGEGLVEEVDEKELNKDEQGEE
jgi:hypothetical protein